MIKVGYLDQLGFAGKVAGVVRTVTLEDSMVDEWWLGSRVLKIGIESEFSGVKTVSVTETLQGMIKGPLQ
jgi:hypothetical protein